MDLGGVLSVAAVRRAGRGPATKRACDGAEHRTPTYPWRPSLQPLYSRFGQLSLGMRSGGLFVRV